MSSSSYSTGPFALVSVTQINNSTFKVTYNAPCLAVSIAGTTDALNPSNYALIGANTVPGMTVTTVPGDTSSVNVQFTTPVAGQYSFHVYNVVGA